jgi:hypothetical protein
MIFDPRIPGHYEILLAGVHQIIGEPFEHVILPSPALYSSNLSGGTLICVNAEVTLLKRLANHVHFIRFLASHPCFFNPYPMLSRNSRKCATSIIWTREF